MKIEILSILPGLLRSYLPEGMIGRAIRDGRLSVDCHQIRDFAENRHGTTDDSPYGGGPGLVMMAEPLAKAVQSLGEMRKSRTIFLTPQGKPFSAAKAKRLAGFRRLILVCGRYEGVDQRFRDRYVDEEISIGDYVLTGGELPALVVMDAVARFLPGVLGNDLSANEDSFSRGLLEHPQYTRPRIFEGVPVPDVLLSGNHGRIRAWQKEQSLARTMAVRPELLTEETSSAKSRQNSPSRKEKRQKKG